MKWTIRQIRNSGENKTPIDVMLQIESQVKTLESSIIHLEPVHVTGYFVAHAHDIVLNCQASTVITLPSTRSLTPVSVELNIPIKERYVFPEDDTDALEYEETTIVLEHDYIDLEPAVIDSLLLNLPERVMTKEELAGELPSGNDWTVVTEEEYQKQRAKEQEDKIDPRFASLQSLLNEYND